VRVLGSAGVRALIDDLHTGGANARRLAFAKHGGVQMHVLTNSLVDHPGQRWPLGIKLFRRGYSS
jgi:hypothetical protein